MKSWYYLNAATEKPETMVELDHGCTRMFDFLVRNLNNNLTDYVSIKAKAQEGLSPKLLSALDYLSVLNYGYIPLFSARFLHKLGEIMTEHLSFYSCMVYTAKGDTFNFFITRVHHVLPVIDENLSGYRTLTDDSKIIDEPVIVRPEVDPNLMIVRDLVNPSVAVTSSVFKQMVEDKKLNIAFSNTADTFF